MEFPLRIMTINKTTFVLGADDRVVFEGDVAREMEWVVKTVNQCAVLSLGEVYAELVGAAPTDELVAVRDRICNILAAIDQSLRFLRKCPKCERYAVGEEKTCYLCGEDKV